MKANSAPVRREGGFTLIEIMLVLVITGIVLALAVPNLSKGYSGFELNKTADDLLDLSRWAQAMAIGQERVYALSLAGDHGSYKLVRAKSDNSSGGQDSFEALQGSLGRQHLIPDAVRLDTGVDRIEFYPDGTIDPAVIQLASHDQHIELSSGQVRGMMIKVDRE